MPKTKVFLKSGGIIRFSEKIFVSIFSFIALAFFVITQGFVYSAVFLCAITVHELSHIVCLNRFGAVINRITVSPCGIDIVCYTSRISYKKELLCTLSGSFANIFCALSGCLVLAFVRTPEILFFVLCNAFLGIMNLIPISFLDGGKALRLIIYDCLDIDKAFFIHKSLDIFSSVILVIICLFLILCSKYNPSVISILLYAAVSSAAGIKKYAV